MNIEAPSCHDDVQLRASVYNFYVICLIDFLSAFTKHRSELKADISDFFQCLRAKTFIFDTGSTCINTVFILCASHVFGCINFVNIGM